MHFPWTICLSVKQFVISKHQRSHFLVWFHWSKVQMCLWEIKETFYCTLLNLSTFNITLFVIEFAMYHLMKDLFYLFNILETLHLSFKKRNSKRLMKFPEFDILLKHYPSVAIKKRSNFAMFFLQNCLCSKII